MAVGHALGQEEGLDDRALSPVKGGSKEGAKHLYHVPVSSSARIIGRA